MRGWLFGGLAALAIAAPAAQAATLSIADRERVDGGFLITSRDLQLAAAPGEANAVTVVKSADWHTVQWVDAGAPIHVAAGSRLEEMDPRAPGGDAGCAALRATVGSPPARRTVSEATCLATEGAPDVPCMFYPICQYYQVPGFDRVVLLLGDLDDTVNARDGEQQRIDCGPGNDTLIADRDDLRTGCETVTAP